MLVQNPADVTTLVNAGGFYGKGTFSRGIPAHVLSSCVQASQSASSSIAISEEPPRKQMKVSSDCTAEWSDIEDVGEISSDAWKGEEEKNAEHPLELCGECEYEIPKIPDAGGRKMEEGNENNGGRSCGKNLKTESCMPEPLCLTGEEAFYLMTEAKLLTVSTSEDDNCTDDELWERLYSQNKRFPFTYAAYCHYRKKGWVTKSGLKFGVDYVLYKDGPEHFHSSYAVLICLDDETHAMPEARVGSIQDSMHPLLVESTAVASGVTQTESRSAQTDVAAADMVQRATTSSQMDSVSAMPRLQWSEVVAHCRVCESARKELVLCYITRPDCWTEEQLLSSRCLEGLTIHEVLVTRWIPEQNR